MIRKSAQFVLAFAAVAAGSALHANAALLSYWNFNSYDASNTPITATSGAGSISFGGWTGTLGNFGGDAQNALNGDAPGASLSLVGNGGNGSYIQLSGISMTNFADLVVTFASRGTSTGFDSGIWQYSTNGSAYSTLAGVNTATRTTSYSVKTADFSSVTALDNASTVFLRYLLNGNTSASGNNRIDNLQINATSAPVTPTGGSVSLLAAGSAGTVVPGDDGSYDPTVIPTTGTPTTGSGTFSFAGTNNGNTLLALDLNLGSATLAEALGTLPSGISIYNGFSPFSANYDVILDAGVIGSGPFTFNYSIGGGATLLGVAAIPEPSALAFAAPAALLLTRRRK